MTLITEISFKTGRRYEKVTELLNKLGLERELMHDYAVRSTKTEGGICPKITFTSAKGNRRGVVLLPKGDNENRYALYLPNNQALYNKVYGLLKAKNVRFEPRLIDSLDVSFDEEHLELLKPYE